MFRFRAFGVAFVVLVLLSQTACVESEHPIADPEKCAIDARLVGQWKGSEAVQSLFIGRPRSGDIKNRPAGLMIIASTSFSTKREDWDAAPTYFAPVKLGKNDCLQVLTMADPKKISKWDATTVKGYSFCKYQVDDKHLTIWLMNQGAAIKAINEGRLKGTIKNGSLYYQEVRLTEPTAGLRNYLENAGSASFFSDEKLWKLSFDRVK